MSQPSQWPDPSDPSRSEPDPYAGAPPPPPPPQQPPQQPPPPGAGTTQPLYPGASYGTPPPSPYGYGQAAYPQQPYPASPRTNGLSVASMVVSIVSAVGLCCYGFGGFLGVLGAILGHVARRQIRERQESGDGMALAGIIVGWIATGLAIAIVTVWVVFFVMAANEPGFFEQFE